MESANSKIRIKRIIWLERGDKLAKLLGGNGADDARFGRNPIEIWAWPGALLRTRHLEATSLATTLSAQIAFQLVNSPSSIRCSHSPHTYKSSDHPPPRHPPHPLSTLIHSFILSFISSFHHFTKSTFFVPTKLPTIHPPAFPALLATFPPIVFHSLSLIPLKFISPQNARHKFLSRLEARQI